MNTTSFSVTDQAILELLEEIKDEIESPTQRSHPIPAVVKLLATLQISASGSFQTVIASAVGISLSALIRIIAPVPLCYSAIYGLVGRERC